MAFLLFFIAVVLSGIAAYYSVIGLIAVFSAAAIPVAIMGGSLEAAKLVVASWLYRYWKVIPTLMKIYFTSALLILMLITSMGIFGFLSKAHSDQSLVSGDVIAKISVYDEKIKTERDNIATARAALTQMDAQVNERLSRSNNEEGAERAIQIRRQQQAERTKLQKEIATAQNNITNLQAERAPIAAEVRKVEAEVGPIKYIAALIYGDNPDDNLLERSVRWLIILLIAVFDPLAVLMLIAANLTRIKEKELKEASISKEEINDTKDKIVSDQVVVPMVTTATEQQDTQADNATETGSDTSNAASMEAVGSVESKPHHPDTHPYLNKGFSQPEGYPNISPLVYTPEKEEASAPKKKTRTSKKALAKKEDLVNNTVKEIIEPVVEDKSLEQGVIGKPITVDTEVQKMIDNNDQQGLEQVYKKIVKELAKKNRSKSTHWGPIKNKNG
jgi:hypothetical protein